MADGRTRGGRLPFRRWRGAVPAAASVAAALAVLGLGAQPAAGAAPDPAPRTAWWTFARGDEILAAAIDPVDGRLWVGTEGGGVVVWDTAAGRHATFLAPNQPGLRSNTVHDIAFDGRTGDAWLATTDGLTHVARATGWWTTYVHPSLAGQPPSIDVVAVPDGLPPVRVWSAVAVAPDGTLWAGIPQADRALDTADARTVAGLPPDGGVVRRTPDGRWAWFAFHPGKDDGPARSTVADLAVLPDGRLVVAHGRRGNPDVALSIFDPARDRWQSVASVGPVGPVADGPRTGQVMALAVAADEGGVSLWLATWSRGVYRWRDGRWTAFSRADRGDGIVAAPGLCGDQVWSIAAASDAVWVACAARQGEDGLGVSRFDLATERWRAIGVSDGLPTGIVTAIAAVPGGAFLGTDEPTTRHGGGIGVVPVEADAAGHTVGPVLDTAAGGLAPPANETTALAFDPEGRLWVGTRGAGLGRWDPADGRWRRWTVASTGGALAGDAIADLRVIGDAVWVASTQSRRAAAGAADGGLTVIGLADGAVRRTIRPSAGGLPSPQPSSLAVAADGRLVVGFGSAVGGVGVDVHRGVGAAAFDPATDRWTTWRRGESGLGGDTVLDLAAGDGAVWAAVSYAPDGTADARLTGGGVGALAGDAWRFWGSGDFGLAGYRDGAITGDVRAVAVTADGAAWAGSYVLDGEITQRWPVVDAVVNRYDAARRQWRSATFPGDGWISAIADDPAGRVWLGTTRGHSGELWRADEVRGDRDPFLDRRDPAAGGLWLGGAVDGAWRRVDPDTSGLPARAISALTIEPATGHLWVGLAAGGVAVFTGGEAYGPTDPGRPIGRDRSRLTHRVWLPALRR